MNRISPLAVSVARSIREQITDGTLPTGKVLPAERLLAEEHSVSRTVVRQALVLLAADGLLTVGDRCRPVVASRATSHRGDLSRPRDIGIWLWPSTDDYIVSSIFRGIQSASRGAKVRLVVGTAHCPATDFSCVLEAEAKFLRELAEDSQAVGAILWFLGGERNMQALEEARQSGLHLVFVDRLPPTGFEADFVGTENRTAARTAVSHLVSLGHKKIACVPNLDRVSTVDERLLGYQRVIADADLSPIIRPFDPSPGESDEQAADRLVKNLLEAGVTAVFAINDLVALNLCDALKRLGLHVPDDMSIIGFDGLLRWLPGGGPVTTVNQDFFRVGETAGEMLLERLAGIDFRSYRHVLLDAPLCQHGSTAPLQEDIHEDRRVNFVKETLQ